MVAIIKIASAAAVISSVAALPVAEAEAKALANAYGVDANDLVSRDIINAVARDSNAGNPFGVLSTLLSQALPILGDIIRDLLKLNVPGESTNVANLLQEVNTLVVQLTNALDAWTPGVGLGGLLQKLLIQTAVSPVLSLVESLVNSLVQLLLKNQLTTGVSGDLQSLVTNLDNLVTGIVKDIGLGAIPNGLNSLVSSLRSHIPK